MGGQSNPWEPVAQALDRACDDLLDVGRLVSADPPWQFEPLIAALHALAATFREERAGDAVIFYDQLMRAADAAFGQAKIAQSRRQKACSNNGKIGGRRRTAAQRKVTLLALRRSFEKRGITTSAKIAKLKARFAEEGIPWDE